MCRMIPGRSWSCLLGSIIKVNWFNGGRRYPKGISSAVGGHLGDLWLFSLFGLSFLFTGLAFAQLGLVNNNLRPATFLPLLVLIFCSGAAAYFLPGRRGVGDPILLPLIYFLSGLGLALISRLAPNFVVRQMFWLVIATILLLLVTLIPKSLNWLRRYKYTWLIGGLLLLATTLIFGVNPSGFGARLWLQLGAIYFQPSEPLKLLLIVFLAAYLADRRRQLVEVKAYIGRVAVPHPSYFGPMLLMWGFSIVLLVWQRDLGAALLFFSTFLGMLYAATGQARYIWAGVLLLLGAGTIGYYLFDVVRLRIDAFLNPWLDPSGRSFQVVQSLLAFASGGLFGQGLGQGLPTAIPVVHTDFVFTAIGEEYGLLGALAVLVCFALLVSRAFHIALEAKSGFEQLLAAGIGTMFGVQTIVIMAGTLKLLPLTGVTLPFVSYGGSSLVTSFVMVGLLLFIGNGEWVNGEPTGQVWRMANGRMANGEPIPKKRAQAGQVWRMALAPLTVHNLRLAKGFLTGFLIVAGGLIFWQIAATPFLVNRDDNPRLVVAEQKVRRGRLLTAAGIPVAETIVDEDGLARRHYPYAELSSVTGYYSIRHGVGGTEATFDTILRGTVGRTAEEFWLDDLLHRPLGGHDVTLTIDLPAQVAADVALGRQEGAVVVMDIKTGAILVMSSHPTYDPNKLDEMWDVLRTDERAPLLNRAAQGLFAVGDLARLIGLIGLHEAGATISADPLTTPLVEMLGPLGETGYLTTVHQLGLTGPLKGLPSQPALLPDFENEGTARGLAVTPLHIARVLAMLELDGRLPDPILSTTMPGEQSQAISPDTAHNVRAMLPQVDEQIVGLVGQATPDDTGQSSLSWFVGLAPAEATSEEDSVSSILPLDPSKAPPPPTPTPRLEPKQGHYAVVAVVVTDELGSGSAFRVAKVTLRVILDGQ